MGDSVHVTSIFDNVKEFFSWDKYTVDNWVFRLHSKLTVGFLVLFGVMITTGQLLGDPIDCVVVEVPQPVMDTYCWIHSTFTLPGRLKVKTLQDVREELAVSQNSVTAHPGVAPQHDGEQITEHRYYQWVCYTLFFQAFLFYFPRYLWSIWEKDTIKKLVPKELIYNVTDPRMPNFPKSISNVSDDVVTDTVRSMREYFMRHISSGLGGSITHRNYLLRYHVCECLNLVNLVFQMLFINLFLGHMFTEYGTSIFDISGQDPEDRTDYMNLVFPKVAKCTFQKYGPSGSIQTFDGLCVLPLNILNEKIYIFLWFWMVMLCVITVIYLFYRSFVLMSKSARVGILRAKAQGLVNSDMVDRIVSRIRVGEWFVLNQLGANLDPYIFARLLNELDKHLMAGVANGTGANKMDKLA